MILVTGATSQVGIVLVKKLVSDDYKVRCLVRKTSDISGIKDLKVELVYGDIEDDDCVMKALTGVESIVHIAGIWRIKSLMRACTEQELNIKIIFIGSTSRFKKLDSNDEREKLLAVQMCEAEQLIMQSQINYVILRPTMLYGIDRDKNILQIIRFMRRFRFYPLIGIGDALKHPVYVEDVVNAVISCLKSNKVSKKEYIIAGKQPILHKEMLGIIRENLTIKAIVLRVPVFVGYVAVFLLKLFKPSSYINYAMIKRVNENIAYDIEPAVRDFGYNPVDFETGVKKQIAYLIEKGII